MLDEYGVVSSECAAALAVNVKRKFNTNVGVGITGAAGPDPHDGEPVGTVWIGIASPNAEPETYKLLLSGSRNTNRMRSARFALYYLIKDLSKIERSKLNFGLYSQLKLSYSPYSQLKFNYRKKTRISVRFFVVYFSMKEYSKDSKKNRTLS